MANLRQNDCFICADWLMSNDEADITGCGIEKIAVLCEMMTIKSESEINDVCTICIQGYTDEGCAHGPTYQ